MFLTQVDCKPVTDEESLLLPRDGIWESARQNFLPQTWLLWLQDGLRTTEEGIWLAVNSHIDETVNLDVVKGKSYEQVQAIYEKFSVNHDALRTMNEHAKLDEILMCTLNKLPQFKPDQVRTDEG